MPNHTCTGPDNCGRPARANNLCAGHYLQQQRGKPLTPLTTPFPPPCAGPECERTANTAGFCAGHYSQKRSGRVLKPIPGTYGQGLWSQGGPAPHLPNALCAQPEHAHLPWLFDELRKQHPPEVKEALNVCARCPEVDTCRQQGTREAAGIWGGAVIVPHEVRKGRLRRAELGEGVAP